MIRTNCQKCLFADFADSEHPCAMGVIDAIKKDKEISKDDKNFAVINKYRCVYGFNLEAYRANQDKIGSIEDLKTQLKNRARINYYMIVFLDHQKLDLVCETLLDLPVLPKFVSLVTYENNSTEDIISLFKSKVEGKIGWKLHNMLEQLDYQETLDVVLDTNTHTKTSTYLWINSSDNIKDWKNNIEQINRIITLEQPECHALLRDSSDNDGLFMALKNYDEIRHAVNPNIFEALRTTPNCTIKTYA